MTLVLTIIIGIILGALVIYISSKIYNEYEFNKKEIMYGAILNGTINALITYRYTPIEDIGYYLILMSVSTLLTAHFIIDCKYQDLPDLYNGIILILSIISLVIWHIDTPMLYIITAITMFLGFLLIAMLTGALGGGDIKLMGAVGMFFHYSQIPSLLIYSFFLGSIFALFLIVIKKKKKDDKFAFGPFLIMGIIATLII